MTARSLPAYGALGATFSIAGDGEWAGYIDELYAACRVDGPAAVRFTVLEPDRGAVTLTRDDETLLACEAGWAVLDRLVWEVNRLAWDAGGRRVLLHGAAVVIGGRAVVLCGASGSGKSTLAAALCARGAGYLSDEIVAFDPATGLVDPYPKPISLREGSWPLVATPLPISGVATHMMRTRYLSVASAAAAPPVAVVLPSHDARQGTAVSALARSDALVALCGHADELVRHGAAGFRALGALVERATCIALRAGDIDVACDLVAEAAGAPPW